MADKHFKVLTATWGADRPLRPAPKADDVMTADEIVAHHGWKPEDVDKHFEWALENKVIEPISAAQARAMSPAAEPEVVDVHGATPEVQKAPVRK